MVDVDVVTAKLGDLRDRVGRVETHRTADAESLARDRDALDLVAFNLMLAVQAGLDIASHVIADEGWTPAPTLAESFRRLAAHGVLSGATAEALAKGAGLRNVVAHGYASVNVAALQVAATSGLDDLRAFASEVAAWLRARSGTGAA
jgi:uncharacterized protein YutE (UPF0331/DUF86 family)